MYEVYYYKDYRNYNSLTVLCTFDDEGECQHYVFENKFYKNMKLYYRKANQKYNQMS